VFGRVTMTLGGAHRMDHAKPAVTGLLGREAEMQALGDLLDHVRDRGGSLMLSGESGIGK
jgi:DNA-binding NtrC family response regulator